MQKFHLVVNTEEEAQRAVATIWQSLKVRGEVGMFPLDGKFRIDVISESDLTPLQISQLPGKTV